MTDAATASTADSAADAGTTDAQIWDAMDKEEAGKATDAPDKDGKSADAGDATKTDEADAAGKAATDTSKAEGTAKAAPDATDIWANAPEPLRAAFEATRKQLETEKADALAAKTRAEGTVSGLQKKINDLSKGTAKAAPDAGKEGAVASIFDTPEMKKFAEEYPEVFAPMKAAHDAQLREVEGLKEKVGALSQKEQVREVGDHTAYVEDKHPDFDAIRASGDFKKWYAESPPHTRAAIERNADEVVDGPQVAALLKQFKAETGWKPPQSKDNAASKDKPINSPASDRRKQQLESASSPAGRSPGKAQVTNDSEDAEQIWKQMDAEEARAAR